MSLLQKMLPGQTWTPGLLAQMLPGTAPDPVAAAAAGVPVEDGVAFVPVPGPRGLPGTVAGTLSWAQVTDKPVTSFTYLQSDATDVWEFNHPLPHQPQVTVIDTAGSVWYGDIRHLSPTRIQIQFGFPFAGQAVCT